MEIILYLCKVKRCLAYLTALVLLVSACGTTRRAVSSSASGGAVIPPLTDSTQIAASREKAQAVLDSIARLPSSTGVTPPAKDTPAADLSLRDQVIAYAETFLGTPYKLGAPGPAQFDCSSFVYYVFKHFGYELKPPSVAQYAKTRRVTSFSDLQKGDIVFFGGRNGIRDIGHVGIVYDIDLERGSFRFIHASVSQGVTITSSNNAYFMMRLVGTGRILPD